MAKIIVNPTSSSRREIALPRTLLSIGRDPGNDLVLPDAMVSRRHAVIELRGSQYYIRDCNSSNGSLVNGDRVNEKSLRDGDLVAIGTARLLFRDDLDVDAGGKVVQHPSSPRLNCPTCGADHRKGDQFCRQCGGALAPSLPPKAVCSSCGTAVLLPARFCTACGGPIGSGPAPDPEQGGAAPAAPPASSQAEAAPASVAPASPSASVPPLPSDRSQPPGDRPVGIKIKRAAAAAESMRPVSPQPPREGIARAPVALAVQSRQDKTRFPDTFRDRQGTPDITLPAGAGRRFAAALIDHLIVGVVQGAVLAPVLWYWWSRPMPADPAQVPVAPIAVSLGLVPVAIVLGAVYFIYGWGVRGATPGKGLLGIAVETRDGAFPIGASRATARLLGYLLSGALLGIGYLMILFGGLALHDRMAGTRVVRRERL
ncbi:MAG: FHA domain-containing protein [Vicinamibacteria bacterium]